MKSMFSLQTDIEGQANAADCADLLRRIKPLAQKYEKHRQKQKDVDIGLNLFELFSEYLYPENLHSDILHAFLNPAGKHQEQDKYLKLFLEFLRSQHDAKIDLSDYSRAEVEREESKIDILIKDRSSGKAIIVENKVTGAVDQPAQLPRCLRKVKGVKGNGYVCDGVIYLRLNRNVPPDRTGWDDYKEEAEEVDTKL